MARSAWPRPRWGVWLLAGAGAIWAAGALAYGDWVEAPKCLALGAGFALAAAGLLPAGLLLAAAPASLWMGDALLHGHFTSAWVVLGLGVDLAAILALVRAPARLQRLAFALVAAAGALMLARDPAPVVWTLAPLLTLAGGALLVLAPPSPPVAGSASPAP